MKLSRKRIAILATDGFEQSELLKPLQALKDEGATVDIISPRKGTIKGWNKDTWGKDVHVDKMLSEANSSDYDGLVLPGGVINPDQLSRNKEAVEFVKSFFNKQSQRPVAAICHGPLTLINAEVTKGRKMTSYDSIKIDLMNAGAQWVDKEVVVDNGLVTSRTPEDLPRFNEKMVEEFAEGKHRTP